MKQLRLVARLGFGLWLACAALRAQVVIAGRVIDETGAAVEGARVEIRQPGGVFAAGSSGASGSFSLTLPVAGECEIRVERLGFYLYQGVGHRLLEGVNQVAITLNHRREFYESIEVSASPQPIDPQQPGDRRELDNTEIQTVPFPAPQDYRNALPLMNGVVQDNQGRVHVNGADDAQTSYTLDGFNLADPFSGRLEARVNIETIQAMELQTSRFSADNGRGSAGALELKTKMGDDRWRFGGTNFVPGVSSDGGLHINKWTPRIQLSGPIARGRAWFHNGFDAFYSLDVIHGLPKDQNRTRGLTTSNLSRFQVNLTPANILTGSFLMNLMDNAHYGLSILNPAETTSAFRQTLFMGSLRDQYYLGSALFDFGYAETRTELRQQPQGSDWLKITPFGNRGNYFIDTDRHAFRRQWTANVFLPAAHLGGDHQVKAGVDIEREGFRQRVLRSGYEVLRSDFTVARSVTFEGSPFQKRTALEGAVYAHDHWTIHGGLALEAGLRIEWNQLVRGAYLAPRFAAAWSPRKLRDTKLSAGWGIYYDAIGLGYMARSQDQVSLSMFFLPGGNAEGPLVTAFQVNDHALRAPVFHTASVGIERELPFGFHGKAEYARRSGNRGLAFTPVRCLDPAAERCGEYELRNGRRDRYDAFDISLRRTFAGQFEWFAGYARSRSRTNSAVEYSLESPIFGPQMPGPYPWDAPNRFHMWGWAPLPNKRLPALLRFVTRNTTAAYLVEYRTGFPFGPVDEQGFLAGEPGSLRLPAYFNINLHLERKFNFLKYQWAWRFGFNNITNNGNPNTVNNVIGGPAYLTYGRGQARAFSVRLRFLGRR